MGKKANVYLTNIILSAVTFFIAILASLARFAAVVEPSSNWYLAIVSLGITPLLVVNFMFLVYWIVWRKWIFILPLVAILINISYVTAIIQFKFTDVKAENTLKIATYNIHGFRHLGENREVAVRRIGELLYNENVDIVCFQEFVYDKECTLDRITELLRFPYRTEIKDSNCSLVCGIYSKYPILETKFIEFIDSDNNFMWVDIDVNGKKLRVLNAHLQTTNVNQSRKEFAIISNNTISDESKDAINEVANRLKVNNLKRVVQSTALIDVAKNTPHALLVCGDFNDTPASYSYNNLVRAGLKDGFKSSGSGYMYTYRDIFKLLRIDYIFYNDKISPINYYSPSVKYSDHNPVVMEFTF